MEFLVNYLEKKMNRKVTKSADATELLMISKLKMSIRLAGITVRWTRTLQLKMRAECVMW